jgi:hypothetical protein
MGVLAQGFAHFIRPTKHLESSQETQNNSSCHLNVTGFKGPGIKHEFGDLIPEYFPDTLKEGDAELEDNLNSNYSVKVVSARIRTNLLYKPVAVKIDVDREAHHSPG